MIRPRIAIPLPTTADFAYNRANWPAYAEAVLEAGGEPVQVGLGERPSTEVLRCSGFVLPGSPADVDPAGYGQEREPATASADPAREALDRLVLENTEHTGKPLLAVCFGLQMLNVFHGGTLVQDLAVIPVNHAAGPSVSVAHTVGVLDGSSLGKLASTAEVNVSGRLSVNSSHHQAVGIVGKGLRACAWSVEDGVVEAIELLPATASDRFLLGVQWHPERSTGSSLTSTTMFRTLVQRAEEVGLREHEHRRREKV